MNTQNVNVKTAAQESSGRCEKTSGIPVPLTVDQVVDLFCLVLRITEGKPQPEIFIPPAGSYEITVMNDNCPDYFSVWIMNSYPVAATLPLENFHRVISA
ncbi:hypothetical protein [Superficieibacter sp. 1612_C1]|uniref:hypothetical protein n=1 Tax=Superficieibacter sp. 1612_C1 TaxID=2780382 RepID=UPI001D165689|nr:hypothetical protein [Superficieibacter sp. 1612_C1]